MLTAKQMKDKSERYQEQQVDILFYEVYDKVVRAAECGKRYVVMPVKDYCSYAVYGVMGIFGEEGYHCDCVSSTSVEDEISTLTIRW